MSLQLYIGNSGCGKSYALYQNIIDWAGKEPDTMFFVIVPEQFTLQTQKDLVTMHPNKGMMNIDIVSFERLAYRIFEEVGVDTMPVMNEIGKNLILRKVAQEKKKELTLLGTNLKKQGFVSEMKSVVSEFLQYGIDGECYDRMLEAAGDNKTLQMKLDDIRVLYDGFFDFIRDHYITTEEIYDLLSRVLGQSESIKNSVIAIDGFTGFTPVQQRLLVPLFQMAKKVYVTVTLDAREDPYRIGKEHQLFYMSKEMIASLNQIALEAQVNREDDQMFKNQTKRHEQAPALAHLERNLFRYPIKSYQKPQEEIQIRSAKNPYEEVSAVAAAIRKWIKKGYRYKDIAVISGAVEEYGAYIEKVFKEYDIPVFLDSKKSVLQNPFIETIRAVLKMLEDRFSYESVFRYLRSGLADLTIEETDLLENYVLALGIRGKKQWMKKWLRKSKNMTEEELLLVNELRERFLISLEPLLSGTEEKETTAKSLSEALYAFLVAIKSEEKLKQYEIQFEAEGELALAKEYNQIYGLVMELFDEIAALLENEPCNIKEYREILEAGLEEAKVGIIPPSMDRVVVGDVERTRLHHIKVLFFVGVNDGIIPKAGSRGGILSQMDREMLKEHKIVLAPTARQNTYNQRFYLYLNVTKPEEKLYLSYSQTNAEGKSIRSSFFIATMQKLFPEICITDAKEELLGPAGLQTIKMAFSYLVNGLLAMQAGNQVDGFEDVYHWLFAQPLYQNLVKELVEAAYFENTESKISKAVAKALYGSQLENSVTRLEQYAACAFAHFAKYGLKLEERQEYQFGSVDMGNIFHQALEVFSKNLEKSEFDWFTLPENERDQMAESCVEEAVVDYGNSVLYSSSRNEYGIARMKRILKRTVWALQDQLKRGKFIPSSYEISFASTEELESVQISLSEGEKMKLRGRIDRLDTYEEEESVYVKVIDYKSGNTQFDLMAVYYGLQLQLVVYLNAAMELEQKKHPKKEIIPAGVLYYNMKDPMIETEEEGVEDIETQILEKLKMGGLVSDNMDIIRAMDAAFIKKSTVIPVTLNKDQSLSRYSQTASKEQFAALSNYVKGKMKEIGKEIIDGNVEVLPYESNGKTACDYCSLKGVCGFDLKTPGFRYKRLQAFDTKEVWEKLRKEKMKWE